MKKKIYQVVVLCFIIVISFSCNESYMPKPIGFIRIDLPEPSYQTLDSSFAYKFNYSTISKINRDGLPASRPNWINIDYPDYKARIHISYSEVDGNLIQLMEDSRNLTMKLIPKSNGINNDLILDRSRDVYGIQYQISGNDAASPFQFFITDSIHHFLRGALYFSHKPNNDSIQPVIDYIYDDMQQLIGSFEWK